MGLDYVFSYGSNMNSSDLRSWLERNGYDSSLILNRRPAVLEGYDFTWDYYSSSNRGGTCNLKQKEGSRIYGVVIEFEEVLLKAFDRKEGHPIFYSRGQKRVPISLLEDNKVISAWVYLAQPNKGSRTDVWPTREYKKIVLDGAVEANLPNEHIEKINNWDTSD